MSENGIVEKAISSLGKGFDITSDFRLKVSEPSNMSPSTLNATKVTAPDTNPTSSTSSRCLNFSTENARYRGKFRRGCSIPCLVLRADPGQSMLPTPKYLGLDGYFIVLFSVHIDRYPLVLSDQVRNAVPSTWDPSALARFIETYGTHIIVGLSMGGHDVVLVRQDSSSKFNYEASHLKNHLDVLGDQLFTGACTFSPHQFKHPKTQGSEAFNVFDDAEPVVYNSLSTVSAKDGITVICSKRGGDPSVSSHCEWLPTVPTMPDAIHFSFIPITSLLKGVPGKGFLSHAINLYMRYKPPLADLQYFLDFQGHKIWAPVHNDLPLGPATNKVIQTHTLQFSLMGPKLHVNPCQVKVGKRPVTGMRLYLEGMKCNRLAIHLQHLSNAPVLLQNNTDDALAWRGSEESSWAQGSSLHSQKSGFFSAISTSISGGGEEKKPFVVVDSGVYPGGPPVPVPSQKLLKFVDMSQLCRGPLDSPGHWLVTGAKLELDKGKICLHVKFSLLNMCC
ncbi:MAC/Perforin domain-containing protein [Actinidia rufa]|uniref:MAC/Perforin domain-containing protein n=1 Tax=Actinidia rufa TaxID=165716 RepID=A0A7J0HDU0_9ERIC|nr:MAC/Perforin domain-containing protein [Actinidia rufa]